MSGVSNDIVFNFVPTVPVEKLDTEVFAAVVARPVVIVAVTVLIPVGKVGPDVRGARGVGTDVVRLHTLHPTVECKVKADDSRVGPVTIKPQVLEPRGDYPECLLSNVRI